MLLEQGAKVKLGSFSQEEIKIAIENIRKISHVDFKGQVIAYLMEEYKQFYDSSEKWDEIRTQVIIALQGKS